MKNDAFAELPALLEVIEDSNAATMPRQAFVTHSRDGKVRVRFGDEAPGYTWYMCAVTGMVVGDQVAMLPTQDGGYIALPVDWGGKSVVLGRWALVTALSLFGTAIGRVARVVNSSQRGQAIGDYATVNASQGGQVFGWNSSVTNSQTAMAYGYNAVWECGGR